MKAVNVRELLTAAIDGELTPAERKTARRLLRESEAARVLFAQLKADAARVKRLPRLPAPADLADNVLTAINDRFLTPTPLPPRPRGDRKFNWAWLPIGANIAAAAGVLVAITLGSYLYFSASHDHFAARDAGIANLPPVRPPDPAADGPRAVARDQKVTPEPAPDVVVRRSPEVGPTPREVANAKDFITGPIVDQMPEIEPFDVHKIRLSSLIKPGDLATDADVRKKLATEMKKDELIRLDLFCQSTPKAVEQVVAALKKRGVSTVTDAFAAERVRRNLPTELMVFTEGLTADEVAGLLGDLCAADEKAGAGQYDTLVAAPFLGEDLAKLGKLLGVPNVTGKLPRAKADVDVRKPLPAGTADQVAKSLSGMGGGSPRPSKSEPMAVVVAYSPANANPSGSKEIKQFVERRGERKADAKPLMLVLKVISK